MAIFEDLYDYLIVLILLNLDIIDVLRARKVRSSDYYGSQLKLRHFPLRILG